MNNTLSYSDEGEVRELSADDFMHFRPAQDVLPASLKRKLGVRGRQKSPTKELISIRLSLEVLSEFRSAGEGWQVRIDIALKEWLETHHFAA